MKRAGPLFLILFIYAGCGDRNGLNDFGIARLSDEPLEIQVAKHEGGIRNLFYRDTLVTRPHNDYDPFLGYAIGNCTLQNGHSFDDDNNVTSLHPSKEEVRLLEPGMTLQRTGTMRNLVEPSFCKGAPYDITFERSEEFAFTERIRIGPLPQEYGVLNLSFDFGKTVVDNFHFPSPYIEVADSCDRAHTAEQREPWPYRQLPRVCGHDPENLTGSANVRAHDGESITVCSSVERFCFTLTVLSGSFELIRAINHRGTNNVDIVAGSQLPKGYVWNLTVRVQVFDQ
jgi:hypothetical protein